MSRRPGQFVRPVTALDRKMFDVARRRGVVRLDDGMLVTLVSWGNRGQRGRCRFENPDGTRWTGPSYRVVEIVQRSTL